MTIFRNSVCLAALIGGSMASADVTPQQVWDDWKDQMGVYGVDGVTIGSEQISGNALTITDLAVSLEGDGDNISAVMENITFTDLGDGTVSVSMSDRYPITIMENAGTDYSTQYKMSITHEGMTLIISGTPDEMHYALSADRYAFNVDEIISNNEIVVADMMMAANGVTGSYVTRKDNLRHISYEMNADSLNVDVDVVDGNNTVMINGVVTDLASRAQIDLPLEIDTENPENIFLNGLSMDAAYTFSSSDYEFNITERNSAVAGTVSAGMGRLDASMDLDHFGYNGGVENIAVSVTSSDLPFPVDVTLSALEYGIQAPLSKTDDAADFGLQVNIADLSVTDMIWMMGDPSGVLPHDPVTVALDLSGTAKLFFDLLDPSQAEMIADAGVPGEIYSLDLNSLNIMAAGAQITGSGAFTFDNSDTQTFPGFPRPTGVVDLAIDGANGLIDNLITMGLIPEEEAMMPRMMMGMFTTTVGDDQLTSKLEIDDEGHIFANGQRLQ